MKIKVKTIHDPTFTLTDKTEDFEYQKELTQKLDNDTSDFDQNRLNEIVLWKVNRYAHFSEDVIQKINAIKPEDREMNVAHTKNVLTALLQVNGVQLPMASTILRFRNPQLYQIIDQRVYRVIYEDKVLKPNNSKTDRAIENQVVLYLQYLEDLREAFKKLGIEFKDADRVLYMADKRINRDVKLNNY